MIANVDTDRRKVLTTVTWVEFGIATLLFYARWYSAWKIIHRTTADIYLATAAIIIAIASQVMLTVGASHGLGVHQSELSADEFRKVELYAFLNHFLALIANGLGKVAIVAFILQWQGYQNRVTIAFLWFIAASGLIINVVNAVLLLVYCSPANNWNCGGSRGGIIYGLVLGYYPAFCDFVLALYPTIIFWRIQAFSIARRIGLCCLMGFGIFAGACAIVKTTSISLLNSATDGSRFLAWIIIWNQTEMWLVFIAGSIPTAKPFVVLLYRKSHLSSVVKRISPNSSDSPSSQYAFRMETNFPNPGTDTSGSQP